MTLMKLKLFIKSIIMDHMLKKNGWAMIHYKTDRISSLSWGKPLMKCWRTFYGGKSGKKLVWDLKRKHEWLCYCLALQDYIYIGQTQNNKIWFTTFITVVYYHNQACLCSIWYLMPPWGPLLVSLLGEAEGFRGLSLSVGGFSPWINSLAFLRIFYECDLILGQGGQP